MKRSRPCPVCDGPVLPGGDWCLCDAHLVMQLRRCGIRIDVRSTRFLRASEVAGMLSVSTGWVRDHISLFPGRVLLVGGDLRIPESDVRNLVQSCCHKR